MRGVALSFDGLRIRGVSRAGDQTWLRVDPPGLALDVGRGADALVGARWLFISHGHLDHVVGLPWVLAQRKLQGLAAATILCPRESAENLAELLRAAGRLEGEELVAEIVGLEPGERHELGKGLELEAFAAHHTTPALGCHLVRKQRKLKPELVGASTQEVASLRREGAEVSQEHEILWMSYCGDTSSEIFAREPRLFYAKVLVIECTFIGSETVDHGERYGHLHLRDFAENESRFQNQAIVLTHLSRRYRLAELERSVASELPNLAARVRFLAEND